MILPDRKNASGILLFLSSCILTLGIIVKVYIIIGIGTILTFAFFLLFQNVIKKQLKNRLLSTDHS